MTESAPVAKGSADGGVSALATRRLIEVAVPLPFFGTLTFDAAGATRHPVVRGSRVLVAVRGRRVIGVCTGDTPADSPSRAPEKAEKIKPIEDVLDAEPVFLPDLGRGAGFLRGDSATKVGINRGLALPCATPGHEQFVLAFLSAMGTPIAPRMEIWRADGDGRTLTLRDGFCETAGPLLNDGESAPRLEPGQGSIGLCWLNGTPGIASELASEPGPGGRTAGLTSMVVIPVLADARFVAAVALYF